MAVDGVVLVRRTLVSASLLLEGIGREAETRWGIDSAWGRRLFVIPIVVGPGLVLLRYASFPAYMMVVGEDRLLEWTQVALFLTAAFFSVRISLEFLSERCYSMTTVLMFVGSFLFFAAGEEISWGQRLVGWDTPAGWRSRNVQGETTVHNLSALRWGFHTLTLLLGVSGTCLPFLYGYGSSARMRLPKAIVPPLFLTSYFMVAAVGMIVYLSQFFLGDVVIIKFSEYWETCIAIGIASHLYLLLRRRLRTTVGMTAEDERHDNAGRETWDLHL